MADSYDGAVSWGAILAGAAGAAALSLILLILGVGLGFSSVSPWSGTGAGVAAMGASTIAWITITQILASGLGGYLAGRLRSKWSGAHADEVFFRDSAHGFLAWAVSTLVAAALLASVTAAVLGTGVQAGTAVTGRMLGAGAIEITAGDPATRMAPSIEGNPMAYYFDAMFRHERLARTGTAKSPPAPEVGVDASRTSDAVEVGRIFLHNGLSEPLSAEDVRYAGQLVARQTGLSQVDSEKRVTDIYAAASDRLHRAEVAAREAIDKARKASAYAALWLFISLLIGAFVSSLAATFGGSLRNA